MDFISLRIILAMFFFSSIFLIAMHYTVKLSIDLYAIDKLVYCVNISLDVQVASSEVISVRWAEDYI